jgi:hypothetical protein
VEAPWEVQQLRVSIFPSTPVALTPEVWLAVVGSPPETETKRPREASTLFSGTLDGIQIVMNSTPTQFDILLGPVQAPVAAVSTLTSLPRATAGEAGPIIALIQTKIPALFDHSPETTRIAFAGTVLTPAAGIHDSYSKLAALLQSVNVQPGKMRDFVFRVNWPITVESVEINRLTTWSTVLFRTVSLMDGMPAPVLENHYAQLEFDINTALSHTTKFTPQELRNVFSNLVALAEENMERGEVVPK